MQLHPDVEALLAAMRALHELLSARDEVWAGRVRRAAEEVARSDGHGLERFLGFFGGSGSLNDLVLTRDGRPLGTENDRLDALRSVAWGLADRLRHEVG